jgi:uncharacterized integral membrane protein (TIGR00697 family)
LKKKRKNNFLMYERGIMLSNNVEKNSNTSYSANCYQFLSMLFLTIMLGTYVLAYKMVSVGGYVISGGIFIFPINYAITDIVTEVYGYEQTKKLIKLVFICCAFFALAVPFIATLQPPDNWPHQEGYTYVLGHVFRFFVANTIGIIIGITVNGYLIAKWKKIMRGRHFWLRSIGSSSIGELITSIIADILAFGGTTEFINVIKLMIGIFSIKLIYSIVLSFPMSLFVTHLKLKFGLDFSNTGLKLNPFNQDIEQVRTI